MPPKPTSTKVNRIGRSGGKVAFVRIDQAPRIHGFAADASPASRGCRGLNGHHISAMTLKFIATAANGGRHHSGAGRLRWLYWPRSGSTRSIQLCLGARPLRWLQVGAPRPGQDHARDRGAGGHRTTEPAKTAGPIQPPLKGLWHKHHLEDGLRGTAINALKGLHSYGSPLFRQRMQEAQDAGEVRYVTQEDVASLADDIAHGNWQRMASAAELTGEWLIYAQHDGGNYYLCLGRHDSGDDYLRGQIDAICCREFPFLTALLPTS